LQKLKEALEIFTPGFVSTHIIIGFEETEKEVLNLIEKLYNLGIIVSLFAFTPIKGTKFENLKQPGILKFRAKDFTFNSKGDIINININKEDLKKIINNTNAFLTSGCPGCNRPYYTSKPSGPIYNFPRVLTEKEKIELYELLYKFVI
jgi:biotin synthase-related radical SAM superfamily protein